MASGCLTDIENGSRGRDKLETGVLMSGKNREVADAVATALARWHRDPTALLQMLREVQESVGWISPEVIRLLADELQLPRSRAASSTRSRRPACRCVSGDGGDGW